MEVLLQSSDILRKFEDTHEAILPRILASYDIMTNPLGKAALIWIIGEYGEVCDTISVFQSDNYQSFRLKFFAHSSFYVLSFLVLFKVSPRQSIPARGSSESHQRGALFGGQASVVGGRYQTLL